MALISVFDVLGPNMIGPSSSHTAGACSIALLAQKMIPGTLKEVTFILYGSFARTHQGHGTDRALLGGIMGFSLDDQRIPNSFEIAKKQGLKFHFQVNETETDIYPNTVDIDMVNTEGQKMSVRGESVSHLSLCRAEQLHKSNVHVLVAETFCNMRDHTWLIIVDHDQCAVFP